MPASVACSQRRFFARASISALIRSRKPRPLRQQSVQLVGVRRHRYLHALALETICWISCAEYCGGGTTKEVAAVAIRTRSGGGMNSTMRSETANAGPRPLTTETAGEIPKGPSCSLPPFVSIGPTLRPGPSAPAASTPPLQSRRAGRGRAESAH